MKLPKLSEQRLRQVGLAVVAIIGAALGIIVIHGYRSFQRELTIFHKIRLTDHRADVMYRLGSPPTVLGELEPAIFDGKVAGHSRRVFNVPKQMSASDFLDGPAAADLNVMPSNRSEEDYRAWVYPADNGESDLMIEFDPSGRVQRITCTSHGTNPFGCGPLAGIWNGDEEEKVLKLGRPSINAVQGVTKTIAYDDIGVSYYLTKGKAYSFTLTRAKGGDGAMVRRFLHTVLP